MDRHKVIYFSAIICMALVGLAILGYFAYPKIFEKNEPVVVQPRPPSSGGGGGGVAPKPVEITIENLPDYLERQAMVKELPKSAVLSLRIYTFEKGYREWLGSFIITTGSVTEGTAENPDFDIIIKSNYMSEASKDLCTAVKMAQENGDFAADTTASTTSLMWKYRSMMEYRDCFGF